MKRLRPLTLTLTLLLLLAACASTTESTDTASQPADEAPDAEITLVDFMLDPDDVEVSGPAVTIAVVNDGPTPHNLSIRTTEGETILATADLSRGEEEILSGELEPGEYEIFCSLGGHESLGMSGTLVVTDG